MLQKFALAFKTKTIEFFAEDEEEEEGRESISAAVDLDPAPEEIITGQRVVVLKPDPLPQPPKPDPETLIPALFATLSSFQAAYLHLQTAHSPLIPDVVRSADCAAVSHLRPAPDFKNFQNRRLPLHRNRDQDETKAPSETPTLTLNSTREKRENPRKNPIFSSNFSLLLLLLLLLPRLLLSGRQSDGFRFPQLAFGFTPRAHTLTQIESSTSHLKTLDLSP